jgi:hypothetical protein
MFSTHTSFQKLLLVLTMVQVINMHIMKKPFANKPKINEKGDEVIKPMLSLLALGVQIILIHCIAAGQLGKKYMQH